LAIYRLTRSSTTTRFEFVYLVVGKMTTRLAETRQNDSLEIWGPLGNGFKMDDGRHHILVAGGIGQTPFLMLAEKQPNSTLLYGARTEERIACMEDFEQLGVDVRLATDDGSRGHHGAVTELISTVYRPGEPTKIIACGPKPMLQAAFRVAESLGLPCDVSLESPMSCGLGICFGCVVEYRSEENPNEGDYRRTCVDGPAFDAYRLKWD
jgi:dihydroorotate dehydrogenase electron transfer subunit